MIKFEFAITEEKWYKKFEKWVAMKIPLGQLTRDEWTPACVYYSFTSENDMDFYLLGMTTATFYSEYELRNKDEEQDFLIGRN